MTAAAQWSADPSQRGVGTLTLTSPNGSSVDLIQSNAIRSGQIAAYLQMRDQDLVQAQNQLDAIAVGHGHGAVGQDHRPARAVTSGIAERLRCRYRQPVGRQHDHDQLYGCADQTPHTITLVRVDDPSALPLSDSATATPNDKVFGIDFSGGIGSVLGQINAAHRLDRHGGVQSHPAPRCACSTTAPAIS